MVRRVNAREGADTGLCPLCQRANHCARAAGSGARCWCRDWRFAYTLPSEPLAGKPCICERCLNHHLDDAAP